MQFHTLDPILVIVLLLNFLALGVSRLNTVIYAVAIQGVLLAIMQPLVSGKSIGFADVEMVSIVLMAITFGVKGYVIPKMLFYAMQRANVHREVEPLIGFVPSLLLGAIGTGISLYFARTLQLHEQHTSSLVVPTSLTTVLVGFIVLITRRQAINQVLGYLLLENGVFVFGLLLLHAMPIFVELGVLLDIFVGVFVMGIIINHISREVPSTTTEHLSSLRE